MDKQPKLSFKIPNRLVRQHNDLTGARYNLSPIQKDIIYILLSGIKKSDDKGKIYKFHISALKNKNRNTRINSVELKKSIEDLLSRTIQIRETNGLLLLPAIFSSIYIGDNGFIEMKIDSRLTPYLLNLKNNFTTFFVGTALNLKSIHTKRIYEMLSQYKDTGFMSISLEKLKERLYLFDPKTGEENYPKWSKFKERVLNKAKNELEMVDADVKFTYDAIIVGKKCIKIEFRILEKQMEKALKDFRQNLETDSSSKYFEKLVEKYKLSKWQASLILNNISIQEISKVLHQVSIQKSDNKVRNIGGYTFKVFLNQYPALNKY